MQNIIYLAPLAGVISLIFSAYFASRVLKEDKGTSEMQEISAAIQEGAMAYLNRQYKTIAVVAIILAALIYALLGDDSGKVAIGFIVGATSSAAAGYIGMNVSIRANVRTAHAASKGLQEAMFIAFRGGAVTGLAVVGLALLGTSVFYILFGNVDQVIGFGFGASLISLFARVGGGIFTKAADVGADLVSQRTIHVMLASLPIMWVITWVTVPVWAQTCSRHTWLPFWHPCCSEHRSLKHIQMLSCIP